MTRMPKRSHESSEEAENHTFGKKMKWTDEMEEALVSIIMQVDPRMMTIQDPHSGSSSLALRENADRDVWLKIASLMERHFPGKGIRTGQEGAKQVRDKYRSKLAPEIVVDAGKNKPWTKDQWLPVISTMPSICAQLLESNGNIDKIFKHTFDAIRRASPDWRSPATETIKNRVNKIKPHVYKPTREIESMPWYSLAMVRAVRGLIEHGGNKTAPTRVATNTTTARVSPRRKVQRCAAPVEEVPEATMVKEVEMETPMPHTPGPFVDLDASGLSIEMQHPDGISSNYGLSLDTCVPMDRLTDIEFPSPMAALPSCESRLSSGGMKLRSGSFTSPKSSSRNRSGGARDSDVHRSLEQDGSSNDSNDCFQQFQLEVSLAEFMEAMSTPVGKSVQAHASLTCGIHLTPPQFPKLAC